MTDFAYGLDFGTSKTALSISRVGSPHPEADTVRLHPQGDGRTASCVLYEGDGETVAGIGTAAEEEYWALMGEDERERYEFAFNFKPHIVTDDRLRRVAMDFLSKIRESDSVRRELDPPGERVTVVGRPASWSNDAEEVLRSLLTESGYPNPRVLPEPVGALFFFLDQRMTAEDIDEEILVIDWGAGTCDFSLLRKGQPSESASWGSSVFGGRLFDDLFLQWFEERAMADPARREVLLAATADPALRGLLREFRSRELKEEFSNWSRNPRRSFRSKPVLVGVEVLGWLEVESFDEFEQRARSYVASEHMRERLSGLGPQATKSDVHWLKSLMAGQPVDLFEWAQELVRQATASCPGIRVAILTGGSTLWPWFTELVTREGAFSPELKLFRDENPELSIARGLSRAHSIGLYARQTRESLERVRPEVAEALRVEFLLPRLDALCQHLGEGFLRAHYEQKVGPLIQRVKAAQGGRDVLPKKLDRWIREWVRGEGSAELREGLEQISASAPAEIRSIAAKHSVRIEGLLALAADACSPVEDGVFEGTGVLAGLGDAIARALEDSMLLFLGKLVTQLIGLPFQILGGVLGLVERLLETDEGRADRLESELAEAKESERRRLEENLEKVRVTLAKELSQRLASQPAVAEWADRMCVFVDTRLRLVSEVAGV